MTKYYRDDKTKHLLELLELRDLRTGVFRDLDEAQKGVETFITAQFGQDWLKPLGGAA